MGIVRVSYRRESCVALTRPFLCFGGSVEQGDQGSLVVLSCFNQGQSVISSIDFASFGTPAAGTCGAYTKSSCHANQSQAIVTAQCLGKKSCVLNGNDQLFGNPCPGQLKRLAVEYSCGAGPSGGVWVELDEALLRAENLVQFSSYGGNCSTTHGHWGQDGIIFEGFGASADYLEQCKLASTRTVLRATITLPFFFTMVAGSFTIGPQVTL